jgi:peroxiredoxin Q/BCP
MKNVAAAALIGVVLVFVPAFAGLAAQSPQQLSANDQAPPFSLVGSDGRTYRLSDYLGKRVVVLAWFARAFSGG